MSSGPEDLSLRRLSAAEDLEQRRQAVLDEQPTLTVRQALQSIAVELARGNQIALQGQAMQKRAVEMGENYLDIVRAGMRQVPGGGGQSDGLIEQFGKTMEVLAGLATRDAARPAVIHSYTGDGKKIPVESESGGTKIIAEPSGDEPEE